MIAPLDREVRLDAQGRLDEDIPCRGCGYNLRSQLPDGLCPECGTPLGRSLQGDFLRFCDPVWVNKLSTGTGWIVASIVLSILGWIAIALLFQGSGTPAVVANLLNLLICAVSLCGFWLLTTSDPGGMEAERGLTARKLVRVMEIYGLCTIPLFWWIEHSAPNATDALGVASDLSTIVGMFATFTFAAQLALRIPDEKLARSCKIVMWGFVGTQFVSTVMDLVEIAMWKSAKPASGGAAATATTSVTTGALYGGCALRVFSFAFGIWALLLINRFRKAFKLAAAEAIATWAASPGNVGPEPRS